MAVIKDDHDAIVTLIETVKNIKEGQDTFHSSMNTKMEELKNNYSGKLEAHEQRIFRLETSRTKTTVLISVGIGLMAVLTGLITTHMFQ